jgi:hypothetical protein
MECPKCHEWIEDDELITPAYFDLALVGLVGGDTTVEIECPNCGAELTVEVELSVRLAKARVVGGGEDDEDSA